MTVHITYIITDILFSDINYPFYLYPKIISTVRLSSSDGTKTGGAPADVSFEFCCPARAGSDLIISAVAIGVITILLSVSTRDSCPAPTVTGRINVPCDGA
jgi:hypothetical protein